MSDIQIDPDEYDVIAVPHQRGGQMLTPKPDVVVIHRGSGIGVRCNTERSQYACKIKAFVILQAVLGAVQAEANRDADTSNDMVLSLEDLEALVK